VKPLLKWAGGKRHIAGELFKSFPEDWNEGRYFEPFIGGAAMFLHLKPLQAKISDLNPRLVGFYTHVKSRPTELLEFIDGLIESFESKPEDSKNDYYLNLRKKFNASSPESLESAALLYVINKLCFNGLYRENSKGVFNVPFGWKKKFPEFPHDDFFEASKTFSDTEISNQDFGNAVESAVAGDFVYFDPPYIPVKATSNFTSYSSSGFGVKDQMRLASLMFKLKTIGVKSICSNSETPLTREIYSGLDSVTIQAPRMVSARASGRGHVTELIIKNF